MTDQAQIGVTGLAVMGRNLARNLARHGHTVALHNRTNARTTSLIEEHGDEGNFIASDSMESFVNSLEKPRRIVVMVQAGGPTDAVIEELVPLVDEGDIIIDCGNAHFVDTRRREAALKEKGIHFVGTGVSGGEEGALNGPSIMPGGSVESYKTLGPLFEDIAAKVDGTPVLRAHRTGRGRALREDGPQRHRVRRHAAHRRGLRPAASGLDVTPAELADIFRTWNEGELESFLIEISARVLAQNTAEGTPLVDVILDQAEQKGTGRWTVQSALDLGVPITGIAEATFARSISGHADQREAARAVLPGPSAAVAVADRDQFIEDVRLALYASKVVAYAQGFDQIQAASEEYDWNIDRGAVATIWRGGCIIRARFLDRIREAYDADPDLKSLLVAPYFAEAVSNGQEAWRRVVAHAALTGIPTPGLLFVAWPTTTRCGPNACRPRSSRVCATCSVRTPTSASTARARSTRMWGEDGREVTA